MNNFKLTSIFVAMAGVSALAGCTIVDKSYDQVREDLNSTRSELDRNRQMTPSSVTENSEIWLGGESFRVSDSVNLPSILKRNVSISQVDPISVSDLTTQLSQDLGLKIVLTQDAIDHTDGLEEKDKDNKEDGENMAQFTGGQAPQVPSFRESSSPASNIAFVLNYKGDVSGLLDVVASKAGLFWKYERGEIIMRRYETKSYLVDVTPGSMVYESTMKSDLSAVGGSSGADGGALGSSDSYHQVTTKIEPASGWKALQASIESMLSSGGRIALAEQVGTMTVTDTPQVQRRVEEYIKRINAISSKQIAIKAEVLEISSDENGNFDTNIMAAFDMKGDLNIGLNGQKLTLGVGSDQTGAAGENKFSDDSSAVLDLLRQNKNVSLVTSAMIYAMNGQPTPFQQLDEVGYLAETEISSSSTEEDSEDGTSQMSLKPGRTSQGFSMMLMPRIMSDGRVMMNFGVDSSRINSIDNYGIVNGPQIQLPNRSLNKYQQMIAVRDGVPLMIAGLERTENHARIDSKFGRGSWLLGGSQNGGKRKLMTMIVLTPFIMSK